MGRALVIGGFVLSLGLTSCAGGTIEPDQSQTSIERDGPEAPDSGGASTEPNRVPVIGTLAHTAAEVPDQARAGEPFSITVNTIGNNGCFTKGDTEVTVPDSLARLARVVTYDLIPSPDMYCAGVMLGFRHDATVRFESPGEATVRVVGYMGLGAEKRLDSLDYRVVVVP